MTAPTPHEELAKSVKVDWELDHALVEKALGEFNDLANALAAVTAERDQARQMLADAPHDSFCASSHHFPNLPCGCWKAGL